MNRIIFLISTWILLATSLHAGESSSAGGGGIICRDAAGKILSTQLLDFYEGESLWGLTADLGSVNLSVEAKLELVFKRMEKLDASRAKEYREKLDFFWKNYGMSKAPLALVPDLGQVTLTLEPGCKIEQMAIRQKPNFPFDKIFLISEPLWNAMDNNQRAGLVLHEIVYMDASNQGYRNSKVARFLNALFSSSKMNDLTQSNHDKIMFDYGMAEDTVVVNFGELYKVFNPHSPALRFRDAWDYCDRFKAEFIDSNILQEERHGQSKLVKSGGELKYWGPIIPEPGTSKAVTMQFPSFSYDQLSIDFGLAHALCGVPVPIP